MISRMKIDGTERESVLSEKGINQFIHENQLFYYKNETSEWFRVNLNASGKEMVAESASSSVVIVDGWIYYIKQANFSYHLYKKI